MKSLLTVMVVLLGTLAFGESLSQVTNEELMGEFQTRFGADPEMQPPLPQPPPPVPGAKAVYLCDPANYFIVELYTYAGMQRKYFSLDKADFCAQQAAAFKNKTRIVEYTLIAICSPANYLIRIPLSPDGTFGKVVHSYMKSKEICLANAKSINEAQ